MQEKTHEDVPASYQARFRKREARRRSFIHVFSIAYRLAVAVLAFFLIPIEWARLNKGGAAVVLLSQAWPDENCVLAATEPLSGIAGRTAFARLIPRRFLLAWARNDLRNRAAQIGATHVHEHAIREQPSTVTVEATVYRCPRVP